jgi:hypothetical protein
MGKKNDLSSGARFFNSSILSQISALVDLNGFLVIYRGRQKIIEDFGPNPPKREILQIIFKNKTLEFFLDFGASKSKQNTVPNKNGGDHKIVKKAKGFKLTKLITMRWFRHFNKLQPN